MLNLVISLKLVQHSMANQNVGAVLSANQLQIQPDRNLADVSFPAFLHPASGTADMFFGALHRLHASHRLVLLTCFPALRVLTVLNADL